MDDNKVQFDIDNSFNNNYYTSESTSKPVEILMKYGLAKNKKQAYIILTVGSFLVLILTIFIFSRSGTDYSAPPLPPGQIIPK